LTVFSVFDMLIVKLLYFSLKVAEVSLSESGHLAPWWLTPHTYAVEPTVIKQVTYKRGGVHIRSLAQQQFQ